MITPSSKRTRLVTAIAAIGFIALLVAGPFASSERSEMLFALALILDTALLIAFLILFVF